MRQRLLLLLPIALLAYGSITCSAQTDKQKARCKYVMKQMKMDKTTQTTFQPLFYDYMKELKAARNIYDGEKDALKAKIEAGTISADDCARLLRLHWASDAEVIKLRERYTALFTKLLGVKNAFYVFRYANDKLNN